MFSNIIGDILVNYQMICSLLSYQ